MAGRDKRIDTFSSSGMRDWCIECVCLQSWYVISVYGNGDSELLLLLLGGIV